MEIDNAFLLPSPNWYLSAVFDCQDSGEQLAYGSRHSVVIVNLKCGVGLPEVRIFPSVHKERVTGVQWNPAGKNNGEQVSLVSCSDDGSVIAWNTTDEKPVFQHKQHEKEKICGISWSKSDPKLVISCDYGGGVIVWNLDSNSTRKLSFGKICPLTVSCSPHCPKTIALGCKGGLLYICGITGTGKILHRLRGHDEDIQSLSWCPELVTSITNSASSSEAQNWREKDQSKGSLIATAAKDKTIRFWNIEEGRCILVLKLPIKTGIYKPKTMQDDRKTVWVALWWANSTKLFSSGLGGELLSWNVENLVESRDQKWSVVHSKHARGLFNISGFTVGESLRVFTSAQDRQIVLWNSQDEKDSKTLYTVGGFVYCLGFSPIDPARLAVGVGDNMIRVMNVAASPLEVTSLWQGIRGKVTAVAWHPEKEGKIAFGTEEGRVGLYDVLTTKNPLLSPMTHKSTVYCVTWGPKYSSKGEHFGSQIGLYSCGQGQIFIHTFQNKEQEEVVNFHKLLSSTGRATIPSELAWNTDQCLFAVGHEDGTVDVYKAANLQLVSIIMAHKKLIQSLQWHPSFTAASSDISIFTNYLAVSSNDSVIKVYDLNAAVTSDQQDSNGEGNSEALSMAPLVCTFSGHKERVVSVAWSPHIDGKLLSVSYDGTAKVWDVLEGKAIASYDRYQSRLFACGWNPLEEGVALIGGEDFLLSAWYIHGTNDLDTNISRPRTKKNQMKVKGVGSGLENGKKPSNDVAVASLESTGAKKKVKSLFSVSAALENRGRPAQLDDCRILADCADPKMVIAQMRKPDMEHLGFFGDSEALKLLLQQEEKHHLNVGNWEQFVTLHMWQGQLAEALQLAAKQRKLSDWMVSLAPQVSLSFWEELCQKYANQLYQEGDPRKASSYLISVNKWDEALEMLTSKGHFREAVAIVKNRWEDGDPRWKELMEAWAKKAASDAHMEQAAKCFLSLGKWTDAASAIAKKGDVPGLALAASLLKKDGLSPMAKVYASQAIYESLMKNDWSLAYQVIEDIPETEWYYPVISAHEYLSSPGSASSTPMNGLMALAAIYEGKPWTCKAREYYDMVLKNLLTSQPPKLAKPGMIYIAAQMAAAVLCQWSVELRFQHLKNIIEAIPLSQNADFAKKLADILLPRGPAEWDCQSETSEHAKLDYDLSASLTALQLQVTSNNPTQPTEEAPPSISGLNPSPVQD